MHAIAIYVSLPMLTLFQAREVPTKKMRTMPTLVDATPADSQTLMDCFYYWEPAA